MTRSEKLPSRSRSALRKRSPCGPAGCKRRHVQTTPRGEFWAFILVLTYSRGPLFFFCGLFWELVSGFNENRHLFPFGPSEHHWTLIGSLIAVRGSAVEVRDVGSHATAADVVEGRAHLSEVLGNKLATPGAHIRQQR